MKDVFNPTEGNISEWNEGNFKNIRLHEAQEMINKGKVTPFNFLEDEMKYGYQLWEGGITILYDEGVSKYSTEEKKEVDSVKSFVDNYIEFKPPFKYIIRRSIEESSTIPVSNKENQTKLKKILRMYEYIVKRYNDEHGLSTRNKEEDDIRGL